MLCVSVLNFFVYVCVVTIGSSDLKKKGHFFERTRKPFLDFSPAHFISYLLGQNFSTFSCLNQSWQEGWNYHDRFRLVRIYSCCILLLRWIHEQSQQGTGVVEWMLSRWSLSLWKNLPILQIRRGLSSHWLHSFLYHRTHSIECDNVFAEGLNFLLRIFSVKLWVPCGGRPCFIHLWKLDTSTVSCIDRSQ